MLDRRKKFFPQKAVRCWQSCPEKLWCPIPGGTQTFQVVLRDLFDCFYDSLMIKGSWDNC